MSKAYINGKSSQMSAQVINVIDLSSPDRTVWSGRRRPSTGTVSLRCVFSCAAAAFPPRGWSSDRRDTAEASETSSSWRFRALLRPLLRRPVIGRAGAWPAPGLQTPPPLRACLRVCVWTPASASLRSPASPGVLVQEAARIRAYPVPRDYSTPASRETRLGPRSIGSACVGTAAAQPPLSDRRPSLEM